MAGRDMGYEGASSRRRAVVPERDAAPAGLRGSRWRDGLSAACAPALSGVPALYRERNEAGGEEACDGDPSASVITETGRPGSCHGYMEWAS